MVVEDEALMRDILRSLLERAGYEVFTADSGEAALRILKQADISVTLTDIRMPGIDGLSLLERI
ncbi:response regulator, partial [Escherichia coli]|nr:response regulator [Escherichia coli]